MVKALISNGTVLALHENVEGNYHFASLMSFYFWC